MKKIMMGAAVLALLATGCQNETLVEQSQSQEGQLFTLEVSKGVSSRTELGKNNATNWSTDDAIYVSGEAGGVRGVLQFAGFVDGNKSKALFKGYIFGGQPSKLQHIVFPAPVDGKIDMSKRNPGKLDAPMIGTINPNGTVQTLNNVGGLLAFKMIGGEGNVYGVSATAGTNNMTGGYYTFNAENGTLDYNPVNNVTPAMVMEDGYVYVPVATTTDQTDGTSAETETVDVTVTNLETESTVIEGNDVEITSGEIMGDEEGEDTGLDTGVIEGEEGAVAGTIVSTLAELETAIKNGENVVFANDIKGDLTIEQKPNVQIAINGNNKKFFGAIIVNGGSARHETAALTIKKINFFGGADMDAYINLGVSGDTKTRYTNNVTVEGCIFDGEGDAMVAVKSYTGGDLNLTLNGCIVNKGMHSLGQLKNIEENLIVTDCFVYSKNGLNINNSDNLVMTDCNFDVQGYAVRFGSDANTTDENFSITGGTLKSACAESDDAVIVFRAGAVNATLTLTGTTLIGSRKFIGNTEATTIVEK